MNELVATVGGNFRWIDILDIVLVSLIVYRVLLLIRGTRAVQMVTGLGILALAFVASVRLDLFTVHWVLSYFFDSLILIVIVLFQDDLRRALTTMGKNPFFSNASTEEEQETVAELARAAHLLASNRLGALIVIEREMGLKNFIETGSKIDAKVKAELLFSLFLSASPVHDGAVIITQGRIAGAGCFLPLSKDPNIAKQLGTRHRAAIGLTEETDALVVLVSEETRKVHLVRNGAMDKNLSEEELTSLLSVHLEIEPLDTTESEATKLNESEDNAGPRSNHNAHHDTSASAAGTEEKS